MAIRAVTFDFWNTLVYEPAGHLRGRRLDAWAGLLEEAGFACEREQLDAVFESSWQTYVERWKANEQYLAAEAAEDVIEGLGFGVPAELREQLVTSFVAAGDQADLHLTEDVADCLRTLKDAGIGLGIVCDVGMTPSSTLRAHLDRRGVLELFDHWSFSDDVGAYKPSPVIFRHALAGLGVSADEAAHVGDLRRTDVAGALAMGMAAVRYTGVFDDQTAPEPEAHHVLSSHRELPAALGVA